MNNIALECNPDEELVKCLGFTRKEITHQPNKGQVFSFLEKNMGALGIVDEDPGANPPGHMVFYKKICDEQHGVEVYIKPLEGTKLVIIKPRLEEWIIKQAKDSKIDPTKYSLPDNGRELHKIINTKLSQFGQLLSSMLEKRNPGLLYLKSILKNHKTQK